MKTTLRMIMAAGKPQPIEPTLWSWGLNTYGQLGIGDTSPQSSPVQVGALADWATVISSPHAYANLIVKLDGSMYGFGNNTSYALGIPGGGNKSSPVQVGAETNWAPKGPVRLFSIVKADGTLWVCGYNGTGQLGLGNKTQKNSPVQLGAQTDWAQASISLHTLAIKDNGTLWSWGLGTSGQLGFGDTVSTSSPVQLGSNTWVSASTSISSSSAVDTNGKLWSWGSNDFGKLGVGDGTPRSSPTQVGALTDWASVYCGRHFVYALKTDGTLWSFGYNNSGVLGQGNSENKNSPVQVGALADWGGSVISTGADFAVVVKSNGTLWGCGRNSSGQLGLGSTGLVYTMTQVGSNTRWISAASCYDATVALRG